jgi:methylthioribose-1-phosphate isomerase
VSARIEPLRWENGELWILDQRRLPGDTVWIRARSAETVARAIESLAVRGAPLIGIVAAYGVALEAKRHASPSHVRRTVERLARTRPTGRNLFYALDEMLGVLEHPRGDPALRLERKAREIHRRDARSCRAMARHGVSLLGNGERVLTYCNTGALATGGTGTALGVIRLGYRRRKVSEVFACETRPVGQGARLTVWECSRAGIPVTLICDNMAAALMQAGRVDRVLVGADRIARNGDTSNKIGTLSLAAAARRFGVPFHVVAPLTTFDPSLSSGRGMCIEERDAAEVLQAVPGLERLRGLRVWNPAFDVTPAALVTSFVTDHGVFHPPFRFGRRVVSDLHQR